MVQINFGERQVNAKIVYYGPGMSGKTTNLEIVHQKAPPTNRGDLTSISTDGDRTLFFDFMPLDLGTVAGLKTSFQIYTVPGQVYYNSTRKLVLQGVDGVVFVADSSASMVEENLESLKNLEQNLAEYGKSLDEVPFVIQYNKRDLPDALPVAELERLLNPRGVPSFEAVANTGQGVFPTLKGLAAIVIQSIHAGARGASPASAIPAAASAPAVQVPAPAAAASVSSSAAARPATPPAPSFNAPPPPAAPRSLPPAAAAQPSTPAAPAPVRMPATPAAAARSATESMSKTGLRPVPVDLTKTGTRPIPAELSSTATRPVPVELGKTGIRPVPMPVPAAPKSEPAPRVERPAAHGTQAPRTYTPPSSTTRTAPAARSTPPRASNPRVEQTVPRAEPTAQRRYAPSSRDIVMIAAALAAGAAAMYFVGGLL